jgi:hypothetical protein
VYLYMLHIMFIPHRKSRMYQASGMDKGGYDKPVILDTWEDLVNLEDRKTTDYMRGANSPSGSNNTNPDESKRRTPMGMGTIVKALKWRRR